MNEREREGGEGGREEGRGRREREREREREIERGLRSGGERALGLLCAFDSPCKTNKPTRHKTGSTMQTRVPLVQWTFFLFFTEYRTPSLPRIRIAPRFSFAE